MPMLGFKPTSSGRALNCWGSLQPWSSQCTSAFKDSNRYNLLNTHSLATQAQALELGFLKPAAATPFMTLVIGFTLIKPSERSLEGWTLVTAADIISRKTECLCNYMMIFKKFFMRVHVETGSCYRVQAGFKLPILPSLPPKSRNYKWMPCVQNIELTFDHTLCN